LGLPTVIIDSLFLSKNVKIKYGYYYLLCKNDFFRPKNIFYAKKTFGKIVFNQRFLNDPELRARLTGSMITDFDLGITFSHKILLKFRWSFGTALRASASISLKFHSKMLPKKSFEFRFRTGYGGAPPVSPLPFYYTGFVLGLGGCS